MAKEYGQYCPLAPAMEVLGERWTMLVVSRLIDGCRRFNEIHRGVPKMSATLLSDRLGQLEHAGLCEKRPIAGGRAMSTCRARRAGTSIRSLWNSQPGASAGAATWRWRISTPASLPGA
jgi:DNA-binding HxlR family transcriptional regulator